MGVMQITQSTRDASCAHFPKSALGRSNSLFADFGIGTLVVRF
jgi:hypothetical protein